jgi:hypothetical protein
MLFSWNRKITRRDTHRFQQGLFTYRQHTPSSHPLLFHNPTVPAGDHFGHFFSLPDGTDKGEPFACLKLG